MPSYKKVTEEEQEEEQQEIKKPKQLETWKVVKVQTEYAPAVVNELTEEEVMGRDPIETMILLLVEVLKRIDKLDKKIST